MKNNSDLKSLIFNLANSVECLRFPKDFMFKLIKEEIEILECKKSTSSWVTKSYKCDFSTTKVRSLITFKKIRESFAAVRMPMPQFEEICGGLLVTIRRKEMSEVLSVVDRTVERELATMQKAGYIIHEGNTSSGNWVVLI